MSFDALRTPEEKYVAALRLVRAVVTTSQELWRWTRPLTKIFLFPPRENGTRGRKLETNFFRDRDIALAIDLLKELGFNPTTNSASEHVCGCSIVADALPEYNLSTRGIESVWRRRVYLARVEASATKRLFNT